MYPTDSAGLYSWILALLLIYMGAAYGCRDTRGERYLDSGNDFMLTQLFNGITFAGSIAVLWGVVDPSVMAILGDTSMFLLVAGLAGALYAVRQLFRPRRR